MERLTIAIDGPAGAGKSTVARLIAERLRYTYIDTGAMYRSLTLFALDQKVDVHDEEALLQLLQQMDIKLETDHQTQRVFVNGQNVTEEIRRRDVTNQVSFVASHRKVREAMVRLQQELALRKGVVMDGRDIGTHVLPQADVKIFLSASIEERAKRRYRELKQKGQQVSLEQLKEEIRSRDHMDSNREVAPLIKADDAYEIDTTLLTIEEVVKHILQIVNQRKEEVGGE